MFLRTAPGGGVINRASDDDNLLTAEEVAEWLEVPVGWIHTLSARGGIPHVKSQRWWKAGDFRFRKSEVEEWLLSNPEIGWPPISED